MGKAIVGSLSLLGRIAGALGVCVVAALLVQRVTQDEAFA